MTETNTPKNAVQRILETYDGITSDDIEYNDLATTRNAWVIGRQITERKSSQVYLDEMARQCFLSIYPTRKGKRGIKAWRDDTTIIATHDEGEILKNDENDPMILKYEKIPLSKVYNDIEINYDWNPGSKKFNKSVFVTNTNQASFPPVYESSGTDTERAYSSMYFLKVYGVLRGMFTVASDPTAWAIVGTVSSFVATDREPALFGTVVYSDANSVIVDFDEKYGESGIPAGGTWYTQTSSVPKWTQYVGGMSDYTNANIWWDTCKNSYDETQVTNRLKLDCTWFIDESQFDGYPGSAYYLLTNILLWNTLQKYTVQYALPITATNLQLELCDPITFNDQKYTKGVDRSGFIKDIKIVPTASNPMMIITLILSPFNMESYNLIIETGSQPDTITESGSQTDTYTEGAQS